MFSVGEDVEADALFKRGWTVSAIARHLGRDRKTVRSYLSGERTPGVRRSSQPDPLDEYRAYVCAPGLLTTRICGPRPSSTRWSPSAIAPPT
jgi:Putative ATPase subunit of terminase (gpP-like)